MGFQHILEAFVQTFSLFATRSLEIPSKRGGPHSSSSPGWAGSFAIIILCFLFLPEKANAHQINLYAIAKIESNGNPNAYNKKSGAYGMFQTTEICLKHFNQANKKDYLISELGNPEVSREITIWYFNWLMEEKDLTIKEALIAYNWGYGHLIKWRRNSGRFADLPKETQKYLKSYEKMTGEKLTL